MYEKNIVFRIQTIRNEEIGKRFGQNETVCNQIKRQRLMWFGHYAVDKWKWTSKQVYCTVIIDERRTKSRGRQTTHRQIIFKRICWKTTSTGGQD